MRDNLRDEVRAAFAREQSAYPPASNLRSSIVRSVTARPAVRRRNLQWVAVAAALLITALVIATLVSSRLAVHNSVPSHHPQGDYGPAPAGVPLFYLKDPNHPGWYVGFDWSGNPRATLKLPATNDPYMNLSQSGDGSYFIFRPGAKGGGGQVFDRQGKPLSGNGGFAGAQWADDNQHQCGMAVNENTGKWILTTQVPGQPAHEVVTVAPYSAGDQSALSVLTCSYVNNRAIAVKVTNSSPTDLWVIALSDGKVLSHATYTSPQDKIATIVASSDATLIALNSNKSTGNPDWSGPTTILVASNNGLLTKLDASIGVVAFSADNKTVLVTTSPWVNGTPTHLALLDVQSGQVLWRYDGNETFAGFFVNPSGSGFAVMLERSIATGGHPVVDVIVVAGDGQSRLIHGSYLRP